MKFSRILIASTALSLLPLSAFAQTKPGASGLPPLNPSSQVTLPGVSASDTTPVTKGELAELVRQVLVNNPQIMMEAAKKMREAQDESDAKAAQDGLSKHANDLFNDDASPSIGEKSADVTLVEFFDYHCGYCRQLMPTIVKLTGEDKKVRVVFKEYPILSEDSVTASRAALAVNRIAKDKYFAFHQLLMKHEGKFDQVAILDMAHGLGIDSTKLKLEMDKPEITAQLDASRTLGEDLGIRGTPALVMNDRIVPGALSYEELKKLVATERLPKPTSAAPRS